MLLCWSPALGGGGRDVKTFYFFKLPGSGNFFKFKHFLSMLKHFPNFSSNHWPGSTVRWFKSYPQNQFILELLGHSDFITLRSERYLNHVHKIKFKINSNPLTWVHGTVGFNQLLIKFTYLGPLYDWNFQEIKILLPLDQKETIFKSCQTQVHWPGSTVKVWRPYLLHFP